VLAWQVHFVHFFLNKYAFSAIKTENISRLTAYSVKSSKVSQDTASLPGWETAVVDLFLNAAISVGLPKSVGQIYGLLFCRDEPLPMDDIMELLSVSKGSASQGLRSLRQLGAVKSQFLHGQRKEHFVAEIRLRKLVSGFLKEQAEPHLEKGKARLSHLQELVDATEDGNSAERGRIRMNILAGWHRQVGKLLPLVKLIVGKTERSHKR
jgi:DNA-binding transcriptional regulator GbsR (MarR family)